MIVSVTVLGSRDGSAPIDVGTKIVAYLEGGQSVSQNAPIRSAAAAPSAGVAAYYADSAGPRRARWVLGRSGEVDRAEFAALLAGVDATGVSLISASGSAGRSAQAREIAEFDRTKTQFSIPEAAEVLGVDPSYLRRRVRELVLGGEEEGISLEGRRWILERSVVDRFRENRKPPRVVAGYDLTFSVPKSVSLLWAGGDEQVSEAVLNALDEAVAAGLRYLERHGLSVRVKGVSVPARPVAGASYLHVTSRALDPQLHHHVVVVNAATGPDGSVRAIDGRALFLHAKTAGYVAAAELRHQLTAHLGVTWMPVRNGIAEVEGIPAAAITEMSTRARAIHQAATSEASAKARQVAAWATREGKSAEVDEEELKRAWSARLNTAGYGAPEREAVLHRVAAPGFLDEASTRALFDQLLEVEGITEHDAVFDRRTAVSRLAELAIDRMSGDEIDRHAGDFLALPSVVRLDRCEGALVREDGRRIVSPLLQTYTTESMLALERRALDAYERGRTARRCVAGEPALAEVLADEGFVRLADEQRAFVETLTQSGLAIQAGVGGGGTGKTTALGAAVGVWERGGFRVVGVTVGGTQAVVLHEEAGVDTATVASLLYRHYELGDRSIADARTVFLVDEASLLSTRDAVALIEIADGAGAAIRLVGDPAQHTSVDAGGFFRFLVEHNSDEVPVLSEIRRQRGEHLGEVRTAIAEFRRGDYAEALERLRRDGRVVEIDDRDAAYEALLREWYSERQRRISDPTRRRSAMTAERHNDRIELNERARRFLAADGTLRGEEVEFAGRRFRVGDEVIARVADRALVAPGASADGYVRNGSLGVVTKIGDDRLEVEFARWGSVVLPRVYLEGVNSSRVAGGLDHAYAVTTHSAQGETHASSMPLLTGRSRPEGTYVGITRGELDLRAVVVRASAVDGPDDELPSLVPETTALHEITDRLHRSESARLASEWRLRPPSA